MWCLNMNDSETFFERNVEQYSSTDLTDWQEEYINFIKKRGENKASFLDIGGGSGLFANHLLEICPELDVTIIDPSQKMLDQVNNPHIKKLKGNLPNIHLDRTFDYIHMASVLHHITGPSVKKSKDLVFQSLCNVNELLSAEGYFFIHDLYFESYLMPELTRTILFYLTYIQKKSGIEIPLDEFKTGLEICFYTRNELMSMFRKSGFEIVKSDFLDYKSRKIKGKLVFLKKYGLMSFLLKKKVL